LEENAGMKKIYVGNLSFSATEDALRSLFEKYGAVDRLHIVTDRDTGQARGFGFVEMSNDAEALKAINALNGFDLGGRTLTVNEARPKEDRPRTDRPGGGGGRRRW
jgi:RNA recognition motif-containing protein